MHRLGVYEALPLKRLEERKEQSGTQRAQPPGPGLSTQTGGGGGMPAIGGEPRSKGVPTYEGPVYSGI